MQSTPSRDGLKKTLPNLRVPANQHIMLDVCPRPPREKDVVAVDIGTGGKAPTCFHDTFMPARLTFHTHRFNTKFVQYSSPHTQNAFSDTPPTPSPKLQVRDTRQPNQPHAPVGKVR